MKEIRNVHASDLPPDLSDLFHEQYPHVSLSGRVNEIPLLGLESGEGFTLDERDVVVGTLRLAAQAAGWRDGYNVGVDVQWQWSAGMDQATNRLLFYGNGVNSDRLDSYRQEAIGEANRYFGMTDVPYRLES